MIAVLRALAAMGATIRRFGSFFLPLFGSIWPKVLQLFAILTASWSRILAFIVVPLGMGGCEAGLWADLWASTRVELLETRSFLFGKITEPFPQGVQEIGAFVNSMFPLDTLFTAFGLIIGVEITFIVLRLGGHAFRKVIALGSANQ